jgi:hypothetical protein
MRFVRLSIRVIEDSEGIRVEYSMRPRVMLLQLSVFWVGLWWMFRESTHAAIRILVLGAAISVWFAWLWAYPTREFVYHALWRKPAAPEALKP